ncbi:MAG: ATP-binding protein [Bacteroidales bacterium]|jgi:hypothetical protein|nr:ATP-binding protein [Bacteroidales bacterium]
MDTKKIPTPLPIGKSFFDRVIEDGAYYVDKTLFIKDLLDKGAQVTLCTRPRRFGKTLNQTMLKCFFENTAPFGGKNTRALFNGFKIEKAGEQYLAHQGKYPVIFLSFKEAEADNFDITCYSFKNTIADEFRRHSYVKEKIAQTADLTKFEELASGKGDISIYRDSLRFLSGCLENYHGTKTVILIDEYDVPLQRSWLCGYYKEMIDFMRPLLGTALKDCPHLQFAVITGCLRIFKESIFTGLNNLDVISILSDRYDEYFGFTQDEVDAMLKYYGMESKTQIVRDWYDGYLFGKTEVYNPWSSIQVVDKWEENIDRFPAPYWSNTSGNDIVRELVNRADYKTKTELEILMAGEAIEKQICEDITYDEIFNSSNNLWNFLFFTGYLKKIGDGRQDEDDKLILNLSIPNREVRYIYVTKIDEWFKERIQEKNFDTFFNAILTGDIETFRDELEALLGASISFMDNAENFYHGFMAGILSRLDGYIVKSNRESGRGRSDLVMYAVNKREKAVIFELKPAKKFQDLPAACEEALKQIEDNNYAAYWADEGYTDANIIKYGIAFCGKNCEIKSNK